VYWFTQASRVCSVRGNFESLQSNGSHQRRKPGELGGRISLKRRGIGKAGMAVPGEKAVVMSPEVPGS